MEKLQDKKPPFNGGCGGSETQTILGDFNLSADRLANHFCKKHDLYELDGKDTYWVADDRGGILAAADYFINLSDLILDLEADAPKGVWEAWYSAQFDGGDTCNYKHWLMGYPDRNKKQKQTAK